MLFLKQCLMSLLLVMMAGPLLMASAGDDQAGTVRDPAIVVQDELVRLDTLIQATEQSLGNQKQLRAMIVDYQKLQEQFLKRQDDNELLLKLVKNAHKILVTIKQNHLIHTFDSEFIEELTVLSQPAAKRGVPKP